MRQRNDLAAFISTVWQIVPNDVPCSVLASSICWLIAPRILETFTVAAGLEGIIVDLCRYIQFGRVLMKIKVVTTVRAGRAPS